MHARPFPFPLPALLVLVACDTGYEVPVHAPVVAMTVDEHGGTVAVTTGELAGVTLEIPPGALPGPVQVGIARAYAEAHPGFLVVSHAVRIEPPELRFALPARLTLPYAAGAAFYVPVLVRPPAADVLELAPTVADTTNGFVTAPIDGLGTFEAAERAFNGVATARYSQLRDGNEWLFENDLTVTMTATTTEPNLEGTALFKMRFATPQQDYGIYLTGRTISGPVPSIGEFSTTVPTFQLVHEAALFQPDGFTDAQPMRNAYEFTAYESYGSTTVGHTGMAVADLLPEYVAELATPLGTFTDLRRLALRRTSAAPDGSTRTTTVTVTLARNVGPVAVEIFGKRSLLLGGTVNGQPIVP